MGLARWALVAAGVAVLAVTAWAAREERLPELELRVFRAVNGLPGWLYRPLWPVMQLGSLAGGMAVAGLVAFLDSDPVTGALLACTVLVVWGLAKLVKATVQRGRPAVYVADAHVRERNSGLGFVSGHAAVAFALGTVMWPVLAPWAEAVSLALVTVVGLSRVYVGAHLPLDVAGGAAIGIAVGTGSALLVA